MLNITTHALNTIAELYLDGYGRTPNQVYRLIEENLDDEVLYALNIMYDPLIKFNYKLKHEEFNVELEDMEVKLYDDYAINLNTLLNALKDRTIGRKVADKMVWNLLNQHPILALFLRKNLDIGFGTSSAKRMGIIDAHSPQKGVLLKSFDDISYPVLADLKYNGSRLSVIVDSKGNVTCKLLRGQVIRIPLLEDILREFRNTTLDGELVSTNNVPDNLKPYFVGGVSEADRIELSGKITSATSLNAPLSMKDVCFVIYDALDSDKFVRAEDDGKPCSMRKDRVAKIISAIVPTGRVNVDVAMATSWQIQSAEELNSLVNWVISVGAEGLMIKSPSSKYQYKKNNQWYKVKGMKECDLRIVGFNPHTRNSNWIGSLVCEGTIDGKRVVVNVGSGLNDTDRPINMFNSYKDAIVSVTYMDMVVREGTSEYSLSNPRFYKDKTSRRLIEILRPDANNINY